MKKTDLYLTSTFTNPWNVEFNKEIGTALENSGFVCYLANRDTNQQGNPDEIFSSDLAGMEAAKCILAIAMNESPNWGAELGYAYQKTPIIALTNTEHKIPLICKGMISEVLRVEDLDDIDSYINDLADLLRKFL
jgi:nucleoside 2-deoxyribosyltransferase